MRVGCLGLFLAPLCFALPGWLIARQVVLQGAFQMLGGVLGLVLGLGSLLALAVLLGLLNPPLRRDPWCLVRILGEGCLGFVPFAVLGLTAELLLGWRALQAFAPVGLMAASVGLGGAAVQAGASRWVSLPLALAGGLAAGTAWMLLPAFLGWLGGRP